MLMVAQKDISSNQTSSCKLYFSMASILLELYILNALQLLLTTIYDRY